MTILQSSANSSDQERTSGNGSSESNRQLYARDSLLGHLRLLPGRQVSLKDARPEVIESVPFSEFNLNDFTFLSTIRSVSNMRSAMEARGVIAFVGTESGVPKCIFAPRLVDCDPSYHAMWVIQEMGFHGLPLPEVEETKRIRILLEERYSLRCVAQAFTEVFGPPVNAMDPWTGEQVRTYTYGVEGVARVRHMPRGHRCVIVEFISFR